MKKVILPLVIFLIIIIAGGLAWYFTQNKTKTVDWQGTNQPLVNQQRPASTGPILTKDGFSVKIPEGWQENIAPVGVSAMVINLAEEITDPALQRINFRSYYAVSFDKLATSTLAGYVEFIKQQISLSNTPMSFTAENSTVINGNNAYLIEGEVSQQGADFKVVIVIIRGKNDDLWMITFNSGLNDWVKNQPIFNEVVNSFQVL